MALSTLYTYSICVMAALIALYSKTSLNWTPSVPDKMFGEKGILVLYNYKG